MDQQAPAEGGTQSSAANPPNDNGPGAPKELRHAVAAVGSRLNEDLQALAVHLGNADRMFEEWDARVQAQIAGYQQQFDATQKELKLVQSVVRGLPQQWQAAQQECEAQLNTLKAQYEARLETLKQQWEAQLQQLDQRQQAHERSMAAIGEQAATTARTLDEKVALVSKMESSVVGLIRDIGRLTSNETAIEELNKKNADLQAAVRELHRNGRHANRLSLVNSVAALLLAGLVGLQMLGGWPAVVNYVALWMPSWMPKPI